MRIRYSINPSLGFNTGQPSMTHDQVEAAIQDALAIWRSYNPVVEFIYLGRTDRIPVRGDGHTDVAVGSLTDLETRDGYIIEADVKSIAQAQPDTGSSVWTPCEQRDNSCTRVIHQKEEIQQYMVHELGHVLGLGDLDPQDPRAQQLTMIPTWGNSGDRWKVTPGYGDVLGLRSLYPCSCPFPAIYAP